MWLDGYNIILRKGWQKSASLEEARHRLLTTLQALRVQTRVYFDAERFPGGPTSDSSPDPSIHVIFVREGSADDALIEDLRDARSRDVTVVTDDRELRQRSRQMGATPLGVAKFITRLDQAIAPLSKPSTQRTAAKDPKKKSSLSNNEVDEWLDYFGLDPNWSPDGELPP